MQKISDNIYNCVLYVSSILLGIVSIIVIFFNNIEYHTKRTFSLSNISLLTIGFIVWVLLIFIIKKMNIKTNKICLASTFLLFIQIYICFNMYFSTNTWDPVMIINNANRIINGDIYSLDNYYFSMYPNNQFILIVYAFLLKLNKLFGVLDSENGLMFIIIIQCAFSTIVGKLIFDMVFEFTQSQIYAWLGWVVFVILIGLSGWNAVTYTDSFGLLFPTLALYIYKKWIDLEKRDVLYSILLTAILYFGYKIKPQVAIVGIALIIVEFLKLIGAINIKTLKRFCISGACCLLTLFVCMCVFRVALSSTGITINSSQEFSFTHMIMMGLNSETDGAFFNEDVNYSASFEDTSERIIGQIQVINERLKNYGFLGMLNHLWKKILLVFNDGSFAWGVEGGFFDVIYPDKNELASPIIKNIYYINGKYNNILLNVEHVFWLTTLILSGLVIFAKKTKFIAVLALSLTGIVLFNLIFEARARYLYLYCPFFIMAAIISSKLIIDIFTHKFLKR